MTPATPAHGSTKRSGLRWLWRAAAFVFLVELVYVAFANLALDSDWIRDLAREELKRSSIQWDTARSWLPGHLTGSGLVITTNSLRVQSITKVESFSGWFSLIDLRFRVLNIRRGEFENIDAQVRSAAMVRKANPAELEYFPVIPGTDPLMPDSPREFGPFRPGWTIEFSDARITGSHVLHIGNYRIESRGRVEGRARYRVRDKLEAEDAQFVFEEASILINDELTLDEGQASGRLSIDPFEPYFYRGIDKVPFFSFDTQISGTLMGMDVVNFHLGLKEREDWPGLSGSGEFDGRLAIDRGRLTEATDVSLNADSIRFETRVLSVTSSGTIRLKPVAAAGAEPGLMRFELARLELRHRAIDGPLFQTRDLSFSVEGQDLRIGTPLKDIGVRMEVPRSSVPDLAVINHFIPAKVPVAILQGVGEISGSVKWDNGRMSGALTLASDDLELSIKDQDVAAEVTLNLNLAADPDALSFTINGTEIAISDAKLIPPAQGVAGWNGSITIERGRAQLRDLPRERIKPTRRIASLVDFADGELELSGVVSDIDFLDYLLTEERPVTFKGPGDFKADLVMTQGTIGAGSSAEFSSENLSAHFLDFDAMGRGLIAGQFQNNGGGRRLAVVATLDEVRLVRDGEVSPFLTAPNVRIEINGDAPDLTERLGDIRIDFRIDAAEVPDVTVYNAYLPEKGVLRLAEGSGTIRSNVQVIGDRASGNIRLDAPGTSVVVNDKTIALDLALDIELSNGSLESRIFDLAGSSLQVGNLRYPDGRSLADWKTAFSFEDGSLQWNKPVTLEANTRMSMTSSGPLVELLAGGIGQIDWIRDVLSVQNVTGSSQLRLNPQTLVINDLDIAGENIELRAKLQISDSGAKGVVFNRLGILRATVAFDGSKREWHILSARERFEKYPRF